MEQSDIEDQFTFLYGLITDLGGPVGIAPAFVMDVHIAQVRSAVLLRLMRLVGKIVPSLLRQRILFIGSPCIDESTFGLLSHVNRREALLSLQVALEKKAKEIGAALIVWKDFPESLSYELDWLSPERRLFGVFSFPVPFPAWQSL